MNMEPFLESISDLSYTRTCQYKNIKVIFLIHNKILIFQPHMYAWPDPSKFFYYLLFLPNIPVKLFLVLNLNFESKQVKVTFRVEWSATGL